MPLIKSVSKKAVQQNADELIESGRPADQAYAIARDVQRDARKLKKPSGVKS
jgi:hypothetical protein